MPARRVTLKDIAAGLGLSIPTVSMALRGHRDIAESTRQMVRAKAAELGYQPDPALRALADYRTRQRAAARRWDRIALLHDWPSPEAWHGHDFYGSWPARLQSVGNERGIVVEEHWLGPGGAHSKAVFRSLRHRGITGLLLAPPGLTGEPVEIAVPPGNAFQVVTFGPEHLYRQFHTVQFDFYENLRLAWSKLWDKGHRRIGLLYQQRQGWRTGQAWRAAYHIEKLETGCKPGIRMPLTVDGNDRELDRAAYLKWLLDDRYDAVISSIYEIEEWNRGLKHPPDVAYFNIRRPGQQGVDINIDQLLRSAFDPGESLLRRRRAACRLHGGREMEALGIRTPAEFVERRFGRGELHFHTWSMMLSGWSARPVCTPRNLDPHLGFTLERKLQRVGFN